MTKFYYQFVLESNSLTSSIPTQLGTLDDPTYFQIASNKVCGDIPSQVRYLPTYTNAQPNPYQNPNPNAKLDARLNAKLNANANANGILTACSTPKFPRWPRSLVMLVGPSAPRTRSALTVLGPCPHRSRTRRHRSTTTETTLSKRSRRSWDCSPLSPSW